MLQVRNQSLEDSIQQLYRDTPTKIETKEASVREETLAVNKREVADKDELIRQLELTLMQKDKELTSLTQKNASLDKANALTQKMYKQMKDELNVQSDKIKFLNQQLAHQAQTSDSREKQSQLAINQLEDYLKEASGKARKFAEKLKELETSQKPIEIQPVETQPDNSLQIQFLKDQCDRKLKDKDNQLLKFQEQIAQYQEQQAQLEKDYASCINNYEKQKNHTKSLEAYVEKETIRVLDMSL